ncbi:MAG: anti-sigma factor antagonist [Candidatus Poribacteria bacterium]|nr:anti-sigma factor antagonist [Candidatus Poribacteria bacterium]
MEVKITTSDGVTIVEISGSLDANTVPQAESEIMPLIVPKCLLVLDMGKCQYVSIAGLRNMLTIAKRLKTTVGGQWCMAGVSHEIMDVMEMTGFSRFFKTFDTVPAAMKAIQEGV